MNTSTNPENEVIRNLEDAIMVSAKSDAADVISKRAGEGVFNYLRDEVAQHFESSEEFKAALQPAEESFILLYHADDGFHMTGKRKGEIKSSKLPNKWNSAKSVLSSALDNGISISNKGKSTLQKEIRVHKQPRSPMQDITYSVDKINTSLLKIEGTSYEDALTFIYARLPEL